MELRTVGALELREGDRDLRRFLGGPKRMALLVYLAVATPRGRHRRDTLLALFWPELDETRARRALRQALHGIRQVVGEDVLNGQWDEAVGISPNTIWCDCVVCEESLAAGKLEEGLALYQGEFLEGFHLSGCAEFDRWADGWRRTLRGMAVGAAARLAEIAEGEGNNARATHWAIIM